MVSVCATCKGLVQHAGPGSLQWVDASLPALRSSAVGCRACALLLQGVLLHHDHFAEVDEDDIRITAETFPPVPGRISQDHLSVNLCWNQQHHQHQHIECQDDAEKDAGHPNLKLEFFTDGDGTSSLSAIGQGRSISNHSLQDPGLSSIRDLLKDCGSWESSHSRCSRPNTRAALPKRVLDVTDVYAKSLRLYESAYDSQACKYEDGNYFALSHAWGTGKKLPKLTKESLHSWKESIPWSTLPKAIQEAAVFTKNLGFRFLWVDALCIIQDDLASKIEETSAMAEIFGNAYLTIAATSASDSSTQPLFAPITQPFKIQAPDNRGSSLKVYVREQPNHYSFKAPFDDRAHMNDWELPFNTSEEANEHTPLLKRAWAFVERLLSPRVLHFTKSEMILECRHGYKCECGRISDPDLDPRPTDSIKQEFARIVSETSAYSNGAMNIDTMTTALESTSLTDNPSRHHNRDETLHLWTYILTEFTARQIANPADRLLAISSVARLLAPALSSSPSPQPHAYMAGHFTSSPPTTLLWYPHDTTATRRTTPHPGLTIPSWSWASVDGSPILFDGASAMDLAARVAFPGAEAWSPLSGSVLEISAPMVGEVVVSSQDEGEGVCVLVRNGVSVEFTADVEGEALRGGEVLIVVLVGMTFRSSILGLVLRGAEGDRGMFRRVGRLECYECVKEDEEDEDMMSEDAEALFDAWFPEIQDMTQLDEYPVTRLMVV